MQTSTAPANGAAKKPITAATVPITTETKKESQKKEEETKPFTSGEVPPLDDRLHRLNQLFDIQRKYNQYQTTLQKLNDFQLSQKVEDAHITFEDEDSNEFTTSNPEIMQDVLQFLKQTIQDKIKVLATKLIW
jgi:hypothetical protein